MPFLAGLFGLLLLWLLIKFWPLVVAVLAVYLFWRLVVAPRRRHRAREVADRLRHQRAREKIDRITYETTEAMLDAARREPDVIEGHAVEFEER